jgi:hypothetical protein
VNAATPEQRALLREHIFDALHHQDDQRVARAAARQLDRGEWRVVSQFDYVDGEPEVYSLRYVVELRVLDEWEPLTRVHWTALGLTMDQVLYEHQQVLRQREDGTFPGGPNDPHAT